MAIKTFKGAYRFLSNFYPCSIKHKGILYPSVEHAFQASKTLELSKRGRIAKLATPSEAKRAGRSLKKIRSDWDQVKRFIMLRLLRKKFRDPFLRSELLNTFPQTLIEGNYWHDNYWGSCQCLRCKDVPKQNHLGQLLMKIREEL